MQALHELRGGKLRWPLPLDEDLQGLASKVLNAHDKWVQALQQAFMRYVWASCCAKLCCSRLASWTPPTASWMAACIADAYYKSIIKGGLQQLVA